MWDTHNQQKVYHAKSSDQKYNGFIDYDPVQEWGVTDRSNDSNQAFHIFSHQGGIYALLDEGWRIFELNLEPREPK